MSFFDTELWLADIAADGALEALCPMSAEFAHPQWVFGRNMFGFNGENEIIATCIELGVSRLGRIEPATRRWTPIASA